MSMKMGGRKMGQALFLHFLDRELRKNVNFSQDDSFCSKILICSLFMSDCIYAVVTQGIENSIELPETSKFLNELNKLGIVDFLSRFLSAEELIVDRQRLYKYDALWYPFYYQDGFEIYFPDDVILLPGSTTRIIKSKLETTHAVQEKLPELTELEALKDYVVTKRLENFDGQGLTINSFHAEFADLDKKKVNQCRISTVKKQLDRELIQLYNKRYLDVSKAHIMKSIPQIQVFDSLDVQGCFDYQIYSTILQPVFEAHTREQLKVLAVKWKLQNRFPELVEFFFGLVKGLVRNFKRKNPDCLYPFMIKEIVSFLKRSICKLEPEHYSFNALEDLFCYLTELKRTLRQNLSNEELFEGTEGEDMHKILLPVANGTEFKIIIEVAKTFGLELRKEIIGINTFQIFEKDDYMGYIVKCEAGSIGAASSILTLTDAIHMIGIDTIIFGGIAFGNYLKANTGQRMGDILVSRQLWNYESAKESGNYIPRGDKVTAPPWLLDRFQNSAQEWENCEVHFGLIASGEKLVNSEEFLKKIMEAEPELIGGEMEGAGLVSVAERYRKDWILVKAISDWGVGKSDDNQKAAAENAFQYIFSTITKFMF